MKVNTRVVDMSIKRPHTNKEKFNKEDKLQLSFDKEPGIDIWLPLSAEGKSQEVLRQLMYKHINGMRILEFDFKA